MMPTKQLNSNVVPSIADNDLVTIPSPQGELKNISFENLMKAIRSGIQIGGRNLLKNSYATFTNLTESGYDYGWKNASENLKDGEVLTLSISCAEDISGLTIRLHNAGTVHFDGSLKKIGFNRYAATATWTRGESGAFSMYLSKSNKTLSRIKLERGNIATDWSPAPEDIASGTWGGVIGLMPITYDSAEKGGAHDAYQNACGSACVSADGNLAFGSLESACEYLGGVCENRCDAGRPYGPIGNRSERHKAFVYFEYIKSMSKHSYSGRGYDFYELLCFGESLPACTESGRWWRDILSNLHGFNLVCLEENNIAERKEVAYVAD